MSAKRRESGAAQVLAGFLMGTLVAPSFWDVGLYSMLLHQDAAEWFAAVGTFTAAAVALWTASSGTRLIVHERLTRKRAELEVAAAISVGVLIEIRFAKKCVGVMINSIIKDLGPSGLFTPLAFQNIINDARRLTFATTERFSEKLECLPRHVRFRVMELITYRPQVVEQIVLASEVRNSGKCLKLLQLFEKTLERTEYAVVEFIGPESLLASEGVGDLSHRVEV